VGVRFFWADDFACSNASSTLLIFGLFLNVSMMNFFSGDASRILDDTLIGIYSVSASTMLASRATFFSEYSFSIESIFLHHFSVSLIPSTS
jgi:hypothetical protein